MVPAARLHVCLLFINFVANMDTMNIRNITSLCAMHCALAVAGAPVFENAELAATVIEPGVTVIETSDRTTMYLVEGDSAAVLIDTGTKCAALDSIVRLLTDKPLHVVATHNHYDHVGNIGYFGEVYMHPADAARRTPAVESYDGTIRHIDEGDRIDLGGRTLDVLHFPGHTPGSIALADFDAGVAFTGDAFGSGQLWMQLEPQVSFSTLIESCGRMLELMTDRGINKLYVGHYPYLKRALGLDYMLDVTMAARRIEAGETESSTPFGGDGARILRCGSAEIVFRPEAAGKRTLKKPVVLLKLDDVHYGDEGYPVPPRWDRVLGYLRQQGIKANFGIIGFSLAANRPDYLQWLRDVAAKGDIEFWNHGYHNRMSLDEPGEFEQDFAAQCRALHLTDSLARVNVGLKLQAWGRHWTNCTEETDSALATVSGLRLVFGNPAELNHFKGVLVPHNLDMEYPFHNPVYRLFLANYLGKWRNLDSFYLQGHPNGWDDGRWNQFEKIIRHLQTDGAQFVTISEYLDMNR